MPRGDLIVRFEDVSFGYGYKMPILSEVNFSLRRGAKITLMGQNGAGKSTIFGLITGSIKPESGKGVFRGTFKWSLLRFSSA